jgi:two-component system cell cycle sensor histidine kinase/response regulator CckA
VLEVRTFLERLLKPVATLVIGATAPKARVLTDSGALHQVLLNLIVNAKEAMVSTAGVVTITTRNVRAGARGNPLDSIDFVELEVSDTGVGIPADIRERIFDLHFTTKGERRGSGIGLASVAAIVRDAGGTVSVESQPDSGSTFRIRLPLAPDHG